MAKGDPRGPNQGSGYFPAIYSSAIAQTGEDYDSIMNQYKSLGNSVGLNNKADYGQKVNYSPISPQFTNDVGGADLSGLRDFSETGGYSDGDVANIRERAISPIRSIYDSANRNLLRQKNLQGGYSPNLPAAQAKMARESSNLISGRTTDANAQIAQMVQSGKLAGLSTLAPLEAAETRRRQDIMDTNTNIANQAAIFNANKQTETTGFNNDVGKSNATLNDNEFNKILETIRGQQSTYGTTPALASTIGNQTLNAASVANNLPPVRQAAKGSEGSLFGASIAPRSNIRSPWSGA